MADEGRTGNVHDQASRSKLLSEIAQFLGIPVRGPAQRAEALEGRILLVPGDTIVASASTAAHSELMILGGMVPAAFVATKAITHGLVDEEATRPLEWSTEMARRLGDAALEGFTAFSIEDARRAGRLLLERGPVRVKDVCGKAGLGQYVVRTETDLDRCLAQEDARMIANCGIVLEANLSDVVTYSVGSVSLGAHQISYWGSQNLTTDHQGREVYGGSDLYAVRGGFDVLAGLQLPVSLAKAVACATLFDEAAQAAYPDIRFSRRNYDVIEGTDSQGLRRIAILEQSWRIGGASGAEIAAFKALAAEPATEAVRCSTVEIYDVVEPPLGATLYYQSVDPQVGAMTKYTMRLM
ncbi:DUF3182 family protein [Sphingomonas crocodyli]|uniref:DUF3182 family protein n=1 Tax=Sphingomonas crocodyli TaxID=1979270 RepID=UPI0013E29DE1|nr:DUF3182 family protein [Sphingomonas crocodyli]